jgi:galactofuranose transport system permease protein
LSASVPGVPAEGGGDDSVAAKETGMKARVNARYIPLLATATVLIGLYLVGSLIYPRLFSLRVFVNLFGDNAFLGVAAVGATFVILSGGIDLSVGSVVAFTSIFIATMVTQLHVPPLAAIGLALIVGALFGTVMGTLIHAFELPPFLVTLGGMFFARGMGFVVQSQSLGIKAPFFSRTITEDLAIHLNSRVSWPFTATCLVVVFLAAILVAHYTKFGRNIYALGGDEPSARLMGLPVGRTKILIYTVSGLCSAMAGVVFTFYTQSGDPAVCVGLELEAIASVVIGGTLLTGGAGFMAGTIMGVLILGLIQTLITFQGNLTSWWTKIVVGLLMLLFILLQNFVSLASRRMGSKAGHK